LGVVIATMNLIVKVRQVLFRLFSIARE